MASDSRLDSSKLETKFEQDYVVHTTYEWELLEMRRQKISKWKKERVIGAGASGDVWLEKEEDGRQLRAVKKLSRRSPPKAELSQEVLVLAKVKEYDHLFVGLLGWYEDQDNIFIAMEYIKHGDLGEYIKDHTSQARLEAKEITRQILEGLEVLHEKGICHRDLKPQNVLIASPSPIWVKIADFGVSKQEKNTALRTRCGTQGYAAPELLGLLPRRLKTGQESFTNALDMWSLGCLVHEILTLQTPFFETQDHLQTPESGLTEPEPEIDMDSLYKYCKGEIDFPRAILLHSQVDEEGIIFIQGLLAPNPGDRPTAVAALRNPWLAEESQPINDWYRDLREEFSQLGVKLDLVYRDRSILIKKADIMQFLPTLAKEQFPVLLLQAVVKGLNSAALLLLRSSGMRRERIDHFARGNLFRGAAEAGRLDTIKLLLDEGVDVHACIDSDDRTVLQWAVEAGHCDIVKILLDNDTDTSSNSNRQSSLQWAVKAGHIDMVRLLLDNGAKLDRAILEAAAGSGYVDIVKLLLDNEFDVSAEARRYSDPTALQLAAESGYIDVVRMLLRVLLKNRISVNANEGGRKLSLTAVELEDTEMTMLLQTVIERGNIEIVKLLLDYKANVNAKTPHGTPLQIAVKSKSTEIVKLLLDYKATFECVGEIELQMAIEGGDTEIVRLLLDHKADVNAETSHGTPLQTAVQRKNTKIVKLLLERKADVNAKTSHETPLQIAVQEKNTEVLKLLLDHKAAFQCEGEIELQMAIESEDIEAVGLLLDYKADINAEIFHETPLQTAVQRKNSETAKLLPDRKANANIKVSYGTPLQVAVRGRNTEIVKLLLGRQATFRHAGRIELQTAIKSGDTEIVKLLLDHKADVNAETSYGTSLQMAVENTSAEIVKLLLDKKAKFQYFGAIELQMAIKRKNAEIVELLLDHGAAFERGGGTELRMAIESGEAGVVGLLLDHGVDVDAKTQYRRGRKALQLAIDSGNTDIQRLLVDAGARETRSWLAAGKRLYQDIVTSLVPSIMPD